jgi:feruloyl-CoA synthase
MTDAGSASANAPFRPVPFKAPDIEARRGADGSIYLSSRTPPGPAPKSIPHALDEGAAAHATGPG